MGAICSSSSNKKVKDDEEPPSTPHLHGEERRHDPRDKGGGDTTGGVYMGPTGEEDDEGPNTGALSRGDESKLELERRGTPPSPTRRRPTPLDTSNHRLPKNVDRNISLTGSYDDRMGKGKSV